MDRRSAIQHLGVLLGVALSGSTASALLSGCSAPGADYAPRVLSPEEFRWMGRLADIILPPTDSPGARDAGVDGFIDLLLAEYYPDEERTAFLVGLPLLAGRLGSESPAAWAVSRLDGAAFSRPGRQPGEPFTPETLYRRVKELVVAGYYTSEIGATQELHVNPMGPWRGDAPLSEVGRTWA